MMNDFTYRGQHLKKWVPIIALGLLGVLIFVVVLAIVTRPKAPIQEWTRGYDTPQGEYMEPDHGAAYYWMARNVLWSNPRPTYHIYVPPAGYTPAYRPWYDDKPKYRAPVVNPSGASSPRTSGGFSSPSTPASKSSPRTSGGFSSTPSRPAASPPPRPAASPRTSGGFSSRPSPRSSPRTSGGFGHH